MRIMSKDVSKLADEMLSRLENRVYQSSGGEMEINSMNVFRGLCGAYGSAAVLSKFSKEEGERLPEFLGRALDALSAAFASGLVNAMNRYNCDGDKSVH